METVLRIFFQTSLNDPVHVRRDVRQLRVDHPSKLRPWFPLGFCRKRVAYLLAFRKEWNRAKKYRFLHPENRLAPAPGTCKEPCPTQHPTRSLAIWLEPLLPLPVKQRESNAPIRNQESLSGHLSVRKMFSGFRSR